VNQVPLECGELDTSLGLKFHTLECLTKQWVWKLNTFRYSNQTSTFWGLIVRMFSLFIDKNIEIYVKSYCIVHSYATWLSKIYETISPKANDSTFHLLYDVAIKAIHLPYMTLP